MPRRREGMVESSRGEDRDVLEGLWLSVLRWDRKGRRECKVWAHGCWGSSHILAVTGEALPDTRPLEPPSAFL